MKLGYNGKVMVMQEISNKVGVVTDGNSKVLENLTMG